MKNKMINKMKSKILSLQLVPLLLILLSLILVTTACHYPEELNMADMGEHGHSHGHSDQKDSATSDSISCSDMIELPSESPIKSFEITAEKKKIELENGDQVEVWTYNGTTPGPELRVQEGDRVRVKLVNKDIDKGVTIHWHGVVLPCSQDGVPGVTQDAVWPGEEFTYEFIARHAGTSWYHSHQQSSQQTKKGLMGRFIVEPKEKQFQYDHDYAVTLSKLESDIYLTNGQENGLKLEAKPGETVRLRMINSHDKVQWMGVAGASFKVISIDGQDLNGPDLIQNQWIPVGGGQRYDILLPCPPISK